MEVQGRLELPQDGSGWTWTQKLLQVLPEDLAMDPQCLAMDSETGEKTVNPGWWLEFYDCKNYKSHCSALSARKQKEQAATA